VIDTHAHLDALDEDPTAVVGRAREAGVTRILTVGMAEAVGRRALTDPEVDADELARWVAELAWFGLRGVRAEEPISRLG